MIDPASSVSDLARHGVAYAPEITAAARRHGLDPRLLAAVAAQETGGPGFNAGSNVVGDGGHGHGIFQIDDRWHAFARTAAAMVPQANADYAAGMISALISRYGDVRKALSAYNAGSPNATGTVTAWRDGQRLGYADSVLRHYAMIGGQSGSDLRSESATEQQNINQLSSFAALQPPPALTTQNHSYRQIAGNDTNNPNSLIDDGDSEDDSDTRIAS